MSLLYHLKFGPDQSRRWVQEPLDYCKIGQIYRSGWNLACVTVCLQCIL